MDAKQKFGARLRELRKRGGLTQEQLGERSGVTYKYLGNIERGRENPTLDVLLKLARALAVELWELLVFEHTESNPSLLRGELKALLAGADLSALQKAVRILQALSR